MLDRVSLTIGPDLESESSNSSESTTSNHAIANSTQNGDIQPVLYIGYIVTLGKGYPQQNGL